MTAEASLKAGCHSSDFKRVRRGSTLVGWQLPEGALRASALRIYEERMDAWERNHLQTENRWTEV